MKLFHETCFLTSVVVQDFDRLGNAVIAVMGPNLTQPSGILYFSQYIYVMLCYIYIYIYLKPKVTLQLIFIRFTDFC